MSATVAQELAELRRANAELLRERDAAVAALARRNTEYGERIDQQAATIDVLRAMTDSPDDPQPIFDLIVQHARDLCGAYGATVYEFDGTLIHYRAATGVSDDAAVRQRVAAMYPMPLNRYSAAGRAILDRRIIRIDDLESEPGLHPVLRRQTAKSAVVVPLLHGDVAMGALALGSRERGGFSEPQIQLLQTFAEQAVIAITSAETYRALHEALEQQTATAEVLQVINTSPGDLTPVFDAMLERAMRLCGAAYGVLRSFDGERMHMLASRGVPQAYAEFLARDTGIVAAGTALIRALETGRPAQNLDAIDSVGYKSGGRAIVDLGGARTILHVPLVKDQTSIGVLTFYRQEVRSFSAKQIALLENFAAQAVIAMENARLLSEVRQRQEELHITFENMGDGVAMFDETQHLVAWNSKFQEIFDLPTTLLGQHRSYKDYLRFLAARGDFGTGVDTAEEIEELERFPVGLNRGFPWEAE